MIRITKDIIEIIISKKECYDMKKTLIVVDMQKDFIDGSLGTKEARDIVEKGKAKDHTIQTKRG